MRLFKAAFVSFERWSRLLPTLAIIVIFILSIHMTSSASSQRATTLNLREGSVIDFDVTDDGSIIAGNVDTGTVDIYDNNGRFQRSVKPPVDVSDYFCPGSITAEGKDIFWVVDSYTGRVMRCLTDGNFIASFVLDASGTRLRSTAAIAVLKGSKPVSLGVRSSDTLGDSPESTVVTSETKGNSTSNLPEEKAAIEEGRLFVQRPDGAISTFDLNGEWKYDLPSPEIEAVPTPSGLVLDYPLMWSLDYETRKVFIYDLERRNSAPGNVPVDSLPDNAPICGLASVAGGALYVITGGGKPVWKETDNGWKSVIDRKPTGSQPPVVRTKNSKLYLLDRDANTIEVYNLGEE